MVSRRYREAGVANELYPDIILIDGGLGQLHAALEVFAQMDVKPPMVISLAKKEELIYVQAQSEPLQLAAQPRRACGCCSTSATKPTASPSTTTTSCAARPRSNRKSKRAAVRPRRSDQLLHYSSSPAHGFTAAPAADSPARSARCRAK